MGIRKSARGIIFLSVTVFSFFTSCYNKPIINPDSPAISFKNDVQPIIIGNCTTSGCHAASAGGEHVFPLLTYDDVINYGGVNPGKPEKSNLYKSLVGNSEGLMPPNGPMPDAQILTIYNWIAQGAKNN